MYLPESLQEQSFITWNHTVKGLMRLWEVAHQLGVEQSLEKRLQDDPDGTVALRLGKLGNDPHRLANVYRQCLQVKTHAEVRLPFSEAPRPGFLDLSAYAGNDDPDVAPSAQENSLSDNTRANLLQPCGR